VGIRVLAESLSRSTGQTFLVENRPGASGNIGVAAGAKAPPDGYTLVTGGLGVNVMNQFMFAPAAMGFDPVKDLEPIILMARLPYLIAVSPSFAPNTVPELVAAAKAKPGTINVAVPQTAGRMLYELFSRTTGAPLFPVAYKAPGPAVTDVMSGIVSVSMETIAALRPHVASGRLKAVAVTSRKTSELLPNVMSVAEQGVADFEFVGWISLYAPKGTPREVVNFVNAELNKSLLQADTRKRFLDLGFEVGSGTPQDLLDFENAERKRWGPLIKAANISLE
jgi:tripartite-type tricarboxylate transporter receptor subunit TctC